MRTAAGGFRDRAQGVEDDREGLAGRNQLEKPPVTGKEGLGEPQVGNCHARHSLLDDGPREARRQSYFGIGGPRTDLGSVDRLRAWCLHFAVNSVTMQS
jgi:hypothetical protein